MITFADTIILVNILYNTSKYLTNQKMTSDKLQFTILYVQLCPTLYNFLHAYCWFLSVLILNDQASADKPLLVKGGFQLSAYMLLFKYITQHNVVKFEFDFETLNFVITESININMSNLLGSSIIK